MRTISISDFKFEFTGYGHYKVTFTSRNTGKKFSKMVNDSLLIDATKNADSPKIKDLNALKRIVKS